MSAAVSHAESDERREMSTAVTSEAPARAAATASAPLPVQTSSTADPRTSGSRAITSASIQVSLWGRNTPGSGMIRIRRRLPAPRASKP